MPKNNVTVNAINSNITDVPVKQQHTTIANICLDKIEM